jgi:hypothetical protein
VDLEQALAMVASGEIHDVMTQVALLAYHQQRT